MSLEGASGLSHAALLDQVSWIRRLARELVSDRELAEDLVQETCVAALEHGPRDASKVRRWLGKVLRNALRQHARGEGRRRAREELGAREEGCESTERLVEQVALQRELVGAVLELEEPYRSTLLLRFFEELPPREIARRTRVPVATVQSRLQRGLARLRGRFDGEHRAWASLFLPLLRNLEPLGTPTLVTLVMKTKLTLAAVVLVAAGALVWWKNTEAGERPSAGTPASLAQLDEPQLSAPPAPAPSRDEGRTPLREPPANPAASRPAVAPAAASAPWTVRLRVLDAEALPRAGIAVRAEESDQVLGTSNAAGWCVFETRSERLVLSAADPDWVTIHEGSPSRASSLDPVLVIAPSLVLSGVVMDETGRPLSGARVRFRLPEGFHARFTEILEATRPQGWIAVSDPGGRFAFERVPAVGGARLRAVLAGYEMDEIEAPLASDRGLELVLFRPRVPLTGVLRGKVLDRDGTFVGGARVGLGLSSVVSDEQGDFVIDLERAVSSDLLTAVKAGYLPARMERPQAPRQDASGWPDHVVLVLGAPALSIRGRVVDERGEPVPGARLWLHDPTPTAPIGQMPTFLEPQMAGLPVPPQALESEANLPAQDGDNFWDWHTNAREPNGFWNWVVSDGSGAFELTGLDERRYRLDVLRPGSLDVATSEPFRAGDTGAVVRLGPPDFFEQVSGRILAQDGQPIPGVEVGLFRPMVDVTARVFGGRSQVVMLEYAGHVSTDAEGRFNFTRVPKKGARVSIRADGIVPESVQVTQASFEVEVEQRCHLEVVLRPPVDRFDRIRVFDEEGQRLDLMVLTEGSVNAWTDVALVEGRSGVVSVSSRARMLQLFKDGALVDTLDLDLIPGEVNRIEP